MTRRIRGIPILLFLAGFCAACGGSSGTPPIPPAEKTWGAPVLLQQDNTTGSSHDPDIPLRLGPVVRFDAPGNAIVAWPQQGAAWDIVAVRFEFGFGLGAVVVLYFDVRLRLTIAPGAFSPPPKVRSTLVSLEKRPEPLFAIRDEHSFRRFLRAAFAHRRKTLRNNLKPWPCPSGLPQEVIRRLGLKETVRAEQLSIGQFVALFEALG